MSDQGKTNLPSLNDKDYISFVRKTKDPLVSVDFYQQIKNSGDIKDGTVEKQNLVQMIAILVNINQEQEIEHKKYKKYAESKFEHHQTEAADLKSDKEKLSASIVEKNKKIENMEQFCANLQHQIDEKFEERAKFDSDHEKTVSLEIENEDLTTRLKKAEEDVQKWIRAVNTVRICADEKEAQNNELRSKLNAVLSIIDEDIETTIATKISIRERVINLFCQEPAPGAANSSSDSIDADHHQIQGQQDLGEPPVKKKKRSLAHCEEQQQNAGAINSSLDLLHALLSEASAERCVPQDASLEDGEILDD